MGEISEGDTDASTEARGGRDEIAVTIRCPFPQRRSTQDSIQTVGLCNGRSRCRGRGFAVGEGKCGARRRRSGAQS